ncbi:ABC transporter ATP-binding protein/permease [Candidatus Saccharibacteria bacterium]|nr:ABC transporter ATP-binding protein/permease [Candidatus Saccharibacteria bacterium]
MENKKPTSAGARMGRGGPVNMNTEKPKNFKKSMFKLLRYLRPHKWIFFLAILLSTVAVAFSIISPRILGNMTNQIVDDFVSVKVYDSIMEKLPEGANLPAGTTVKDLLEKMKPDQNMVELSEMADKIPAAQVDLIENLDLSKKPEFHYDKLAEIGGFLIILYLISVAANYLSGWIASGVIMKIVRKMREQISGKINRLPISYFDKHQFGDTLSRVTNDVDTIGQSLTQALSQAISAVFLAIGILAMMFSISWLMALVAVAILPISFGLIGMVVKRSQRHFRNQQNQLAELNGHIEETYAGQIVVRAFSGEQKATKEFAGINNRLKGSTWRSQFLSGLMMPMMHVVSNFGYVASAVLGGWLALNGRLNIGDIQAFIQYMGQINQPITQVAQIANLFQSTAAAAERVFVFLDEKEEPTESPDAKILSKISGQVEFNKINFSYEPGKKIIRNFSAHIKPGAKIALVGPTGAGKTTVVNLLMRFYDIDSGSIKIDGVDIRDMKRSDVRRLFGMVLQDTWLISDTIEANLKYGSPNITDQDMKKIAKFAHVDHFVRALPAGYNTKINEDSENISTGERQLLTIARAMMLDAPMLILDEATSNVDTRTEVLIQEAMERLMRGRTTFVIAHRLSTIVNSDLILVMQKGNIVEQGTHRELLARNGFYAKLYNSQFVGE